MVRFFKSDPAREQAIADSQAAWRRVNEIRQQIRETPQEDWGRALDGYQALAKAEEAAQAADRRVHEEYLRVKRENGDGNW